MKNIIITGTSRGIGFALALQLADAGHNILALSRQTPQELLQHPNISCLAVELADTDWVSVEDFLKSWHRVDAIVHNAGALVLKPFAQTTRADFERIEPPLEINRDIYEPKRPVFPVREFVPEQPHGAVIEKLSENVLAASKS